MNAVWTQLYVDMALHSHSVTGGWFWILSPADISGFIPSSVPLLAHQQKPDGDDGDGWPKPETEEY